MRRLGASELLEAWELGSLRGSAVERALLLLAAATGAPPAALADSSVGHLDAQLLDLREHVFGERLTGLVACPGCGEELEVALRVADVRAPAPQSAEPAAEGQTGSLAAGGYQVGFRAVDSHDAAAAAAAADPVAARLVLLRRCLEASDGAGRPVDPAELPSEVVEAVARRMAEADPQADVRLALTCPGCGRGFSVPFDAGSFVWAEVEGWARRALFEVHQLAAAYGWTEAEVLALGPCRRQMYLEMMGQ
jgi:hypothetical protein